LRRIVKQFQEEGIHLAHLPIMDRSSGLLTAGSQMRFPRF
jgi:hypothetical protein